jgi:glycosyltransferase involved in cell wall biosynthesis
MIFTHMKIIFHLLQETRLLRLWCSDIIVKMKVAIVHDDLVQWGGAERVLLAISESFPTAPIFTSVFDKSNPMLSEAFGSKKVITSFMQNIPGWKNLYKIMLPLYPIAFEQFDFSDYDLVISQTTRFAKSVITKPTTKHICYCHTPPRFLWNFSSEKTSIFLKPYLNFLRVYDQISSKRVDEFLAGSKNAKKRIKKIYGQECKVLQPFVDEKFFDKKGTFDGGYFLIISRLNSYKRVDLAVNVFSKNGKPLKIIGKGPAQGNLKFKAQKNVEFLESVSESTLLNLIAGCRALVITAEEDFGMTALEAQAMGKPVIAYGVGGALETVIEGKTGVFFSKQTEESLSEAIEKFEKLELKGDNCIENAKRFSKVIFQKNLLSFVRA